MGYAYASTYASGWDETQQVSDSDSTHVHDYEQRMPF
jgi:hypothetical protein